MKLINVIDEDFINYKIPSMYIAFPKCSFKCELECGRAICQNSSLARAQTIDIDKEEICERYLSNDITKAIVLCGLEPFDTPLDLISFIDCLRTKYRCSDDIVIYTGYTEEELEQGVRYVDGKTQKSEVHKNIWETLQNYENIIVKFGRFIPEQEAHFDQVLGVSLASLNQYAKKIS